jgi:cytochrome c oxidase cbb3-type subunit III
MKNLISKYFPALLVLFPAIASAQESASPSSASYFANPLFNSLLALIVILLIVIIALSQVLKNIAESDFFADKLKERNEKSNGPSVKNLSIVFLLFFAVSANAQNQRAGEWVVGGMNLAVFLIMAVIIAAELGIIYILYRIILNAVGSGDKEIIAVKPKTRSILEKLNASVDIEKEQDIMLGHEYDGIRELDNDLPPWWKYGFYATVVFAVIYLVHYHVSNTGDLQNVEYEKSVAQAKAEVEEYMKSAASNVDETTVKLLGESDIAAGKDVFIANCAACHGKEGQGGVGPNMTDAYWLHGGSLSDIFKSVKYGWVDKGMKAWKEDLSPTQIAQISSFIKSINATNPAGAKAAEGELYTETVLPNDSTIVKADSKVVKTDTIK